MAKYYKTDQITINDFTDEVIEDYYNKGYVFTRIGKGVMNQTRSVRVELEKFDLSSENRRVLKHTEGIRIEEIALPIGDKYEWSMARLAKDFYEKKFGKKVFSANKAKELLTNTKKSNFNVLLKTSVDRDLLGYVICTQTRKIFHYAYPFYLYAKFPNNYGMGMLISAIWNRKLHDKKYFYLGSYTRTSDKYKTQFKGVEWFNGNEWSGDIEELKSTVIDD